jgi:hypothetical protein
MNSLFFDSRNPCRTAQRSSFAVVWVFSVLAPFCLHAQSTDNSAAEFRTAAAALSAGRLNGGAEIEATQEKALAYLDGVVIATLNSSVAPNLEGTNQRLAALVSGNPPVGENYRLLKLGGSPAAYAMVINFGLGGPAAVRIYAGAVGHYGLSARIDHFTQKEFFDSDIELVLVSLNEMVFVTVGGRTDDLATGMFSAWRFDGQRVAPLWSSDLLQQSNYETDADGFHLTYCGQPDDDHPAQCLKMTRDLYRYVNGEWKRISTADLPPVKPAAK